MSAQDILILRRHQGVPNGQQQRRDGQQVQRILWTQAKRSRALVRLGGALRLPSQRRT